mmetsp:Transcript_40550/g.61808  ORF Transcript_40550/g.61808 Transcript_40550/m.61808 type:complete len:92 (+) Transcript_40550:114-389(+)
MTTITVFALFGDDLKLLLTPKSADSTFDLLTLISMIAFILEIIISCLAKTEYWNSFYFYLDVISTISLLFDISWFWESITGVDDIEGSQLT